tara:strand:+ start:217 stop:342 length:126 start_codon:yes stop_codon:yes gene_type:complete
MEAVKAEFHQIDHQAVLQVVWSSNKRADSSTEEINGDKDNG